MWWGLGALLLVVVAVGLYVSGLWLLLRRQPAELRRQVEWTDLGPTPLGEQGYTPQGMTMVRGKIVLANTWKDTKSRVYRYEPETFELLDWFDMPADARHTSGLGFDGEHLWAVDYRANRCYKIDPEESFRTGMVRVLASFDTGLRGASALCALQLEGRSLLAISDFMGTRRTYIVDPEEAVSDGRMESAIEWSYANGGFSQGLLFDGTHLFESENKRGIDVVNKLDIELLRKTGSARASTIAQYDGPSKRIEDLAFDGVSFFTSDESTFRFYKAKLR